MGVQSGPLWAPVGGAPQPGSTRHRGSRAVPTTGLPKKGLPSPERGMCQAGPGVLGSEISCPRGSLTQTSAWSAHSPSFPSLPTPQVNWGARACNTYNEVSVALAKFNYGCICFLIFPRWFDLKGGGENTPNYKGTDCTVAFCKKVRNPDRFFQTPALSRCVRIHRVAAEDRYYPA